MLETEEKMTQEIRPFLKINDSFKKIIITSNTPKPFYNDQGILIMNHSFVDGIYIGEFVDSLEKYLAGF